MTGRWFEPSKCQGTFSSSSTAALKLPLRPFLTSKTIEASRPSETSLKRQAALRDAPHSIHSRIFSNSRISPADISSGKLARCDSADNFGDDRGDGGGDSLRKCLHFRFGLSSKAGFNTVELDSPNPSPTPSHRLIPGFRVDRETSRQVGRLRRLQRIRPSL